VETTTVVAAGGQGRPARAIDRAAAIRTTVVPSSMADASQSAQPTGSTLAAA
jgi:hypothetical protein